MRAAILLALLFVAPALGNHGVHPEFGAGETAFQVYEGPGNAPEPTIGIPWNSDDVFYLAGSITYRLHFEDDGSTVWEDVSPVTTTPVNLDPMLIADELTGRILSGGLVGPCSIMNYSDDNGETWLPTANMCSGAQFDHQSIGMGPKPGVGNPNNAPQLQNAYYCGQLILIGCSVSLDGGATWTAPTPALTQMAVPTTDGPAADCGGFHGHWRTSSVTGTAALPVPACSQMGMLIANVVADGTEALGVTGLAFEGRLIPGSHEWVGGFDPSMSFTRDSGWLYYGMADYMGARMALSLDEGLNWETIGGGMTGGGDSWLDVGQFHDPPIVAATFADVQAGDDDRVVFSFLGLEDLDGDGLGEEYESLYNCDVTEENRVWRYYIAQSFDAGQTWEVARMSDDIIQRGGIWDGGGGNPCRNLLDFNDMDVDSTGRAYVAFADGCLEECESGVGPGPYSQAARLFRQNGGHGVFAEFDTAPIDLRETTDSDNDGTPDAEDEDIDGDGVPNAEDDDVDGDGITNAEDDDADGDGISNGADETPNGLVLESKESPAGIVAFSALGLLALAIARRK
jgi:hypothetical protein